MKNILFLIFILGSFNGCVETLSVENLAPVITGLRTPYNDNEGLRIDYTLNDLEGDDASVVFEICEENETQCGFGIVNKAQTDPLNRLNTTPKASHVEHAILWDFGCGRIMPEDGKNIGSDLKKKYMVKLSISGVANTSKVSDTFILEDLGFTMKYDCEK